MIVDREKEEQQLVTGLSSIETNKEVTVWSKTAGALIANVQVTRGAELSHEAR